MIRIPFRMMMKSAASILSSIWASVIMMSMA